MEVTGAATFTPISFPEMEQFIKRAFRALKPKQGDHRGEIYYDLYLNDSKTLGIRVFTSIGSGRDMAAGEGADAIRVGLYNFKKNGPLKRGNFPIVKRTQNWRDSLKDRIEDCVEMYSEREEALEAGRWIDWDKPPPV